MVKKLKKIAQEQQASPAKLLDNPLAGNIKDSAQQIWLAGMGAFARAQAEGGKVFEALVGEGMKLQRKTQSAAEDRVNEVAGKMTAVAEGVTAKAGAQWDKLESIFEERVSKALNKLGVPSRDDINALIKRIDALGARLGDAPKAARKTASATQDRVQSHPQSHPRGHHQGRHQGRPRLRHARAQGRTGEGAQDVHRRRRRARAAPLAEPRRRAARPARQPRIGLALAGGGPLGAIYEIGALCALEEALVGVDFTRLDGYLGVSAGAFIAASLANGMTPRELCASFIENDASRADILEPDLFLRPAWGEFARRLRALPGLAAQAGIDLALRGRSKLAALERLGRAMPAGVFSADALQRQLAAMFSVPGRSNDFRTLERRLVLVATDLDSGDAVPFGLPGHDHVPISLAVQASAALPGMFPPVVIDGHAFVDGALKKTLHASVLLDEGVELLIALNPLVPFDGRASQAPARVLGRSQEPIPHMVDGGLPLVLAQTFRSLIHSRLALGMKGYQRSHPQRRHRAVRTRPARRGVLRRQHLQHVAATAPGRTRLPEHARDAARTAQRAGCDVRTAWGRDRRRGVGRRVASPDRQDRREARAQYRGPRHARARAARRHVERPGIPARRRRVGAAQQGHQAR